MNTSSPLPSPAADEQAALWAVRLEGEPLSPVDHALLQAWLAESPAHAERLAEYRQLSFDLDQQLPELARAGGVAYPSEPAPTWATSARKWSWVLGLSGAGAAAVFTFAVWQAHRTAEPELIQTPTGSRRSFTLADGTQVELNAATRIQIEKSVAERRVRLDDGEAYFRVAQDRNHPFIVETPAGSVRVTGTVFDVRSEAPGQLDVVVVEGSVSVQPLAAKGSPLAQTVALQAGERLSATEQGTQFGAVSVDEVDQALAWRQGKAIFVRTPLSEALEAFARYSDQKLTVTPAAAQVKVGGIYHLESDGLDKFLAGLATPEFQLKVNRGADGSVRVSLQSEP